MARKGLAKVALSITTLDRGLARSMEPRAATPEKRLEALAELSEAGIRTAVMAAPMIPSLNEPEMEAILERAAEAGASEAGYILLRLPLEISSLFREWLETEVPDRASRVMKLIRDMRGGKDYDPLSGCVCRGRAVCRDDGPPVPHCHPQTGPEPPSSRPGYKPVHCAAGGAGRPAETAVGR